MARLIDTHPHLLMDDETYRKTIRDLRYEPAPPADALFVRRGWVWRVPHSGIGYLVNQAHPFRRASIVERVRAVFGVQPAS